METDWLQSIVLIAHLNLLSIVVLLMSGLVLSLYSQSSSAGGKLEPTKRGPTAYSQVRSPSDPTMWGGW